MMPESLNFLVTEVIQRHALLCNGLFMVVSETTHSCTEVVEPFEALISIHHSNLPDRARRLIANKDSNY
jgi:hypothetical protein